MHTDKEPEPQESQGDGNAAPRAARAAELEARVAELEARWLRTQADYQNARRRAQQELEDALLRTTQPLLEELLLVCDYLDMALSTPCTSADAKNLAAGVQLTRSKLVQALELFDVRPIPTTGKFDPARHEAGETRASADQPPGTILATVRAGYTWQGRILRPARVVVAAAPENAETH